MRALVLLVLGAALLPGCQRYCKRDTGPDLDTGWFTSDEDTGCDEVILRTWPEEGDDDWYWRSPPAVSTATGEDAVYDARLLDADGVEVPTEMVWVGTSFSSVFEDTLAPDADYVYEVSDCTGTQSIAFRTSAYGLPLEVGPSQLVGTTFVFDLSKARWDEPPNFGAIMSLYFDTPVLIGVEWADDQLLDLLGAQGNKTDLGEYKQLAGEPTWDFPVADFTQAPWFEASAQEIVVEFSDVEVIIHDFTLSATFAPDGSAMGGGRVSGFGDTRHMGLLVSQPSNPDAICELAASAQVACEPCPDGEVYCLRMSARDAEGTLVPDLVLRPIE